MVCTNKEKNTETAGLIQGYGTLLLCQDVAA